MIYSATLWWTDDELDLLRLKLAEEGPHVDRFIVCEANRTFRGRPREWTWGSDQRNARLLGPHPYLKKLQVVRCEVDHIRGESERACAARNAIQREASMPAHVDDADVVIWSDLDEIHHRDDVAWIIQQAQIRGLVRPRLHQHYYAIDLWRGYGWQRSIAMAGRFWNRLGQQSIDTLRRTYQGMAIDSNGRHFSWLTRNMNRRTIRHKASNHAHPRNAGRGCRNFDRLRSPAGEPLNMVLVDETYPPGILENWNLWKRYATSSNMATTAVEPTTRPAC
ncbi:MAG: hypothetical protein IID44_23880 [Planctomycetes bacterium]|nr:hypothetical protein [Planctomycetota bacterium]